MSLCGSHVDIDPLRTGRSALHGFHLLKTCAHRSPRRPRAKGCFRHSVRKARHCGTCTCVLAIGQNSLLVTAQASPWRDSLALSTAFVGAVVWVKFFEKLAQSGFLDQVCALGGSSNRLVMLTRVALTGAALVQKLSRKLVHISSGPLFILTWPLFRCGCKKYAISFSHCFSVYLSAVGVNKNQHGASEQPCGTYQVFACMRTAMSKMGCKMQQLPCL